MRKVRDRGALSSSEDVDYSRNVFKRIASGKNSRWGHRIEFGRDN